MANRLILVFLLVIALTAGVQAKPMPHEAVPDPLKPWISWVLDGVDRDFCPFRHDQFADTQCVWTSPLELSLGATGGSFRQTVTVYKEGWVTLPGRQPVWPVAVESRGKALAVVEREGRPAVKLEPGEYPMSGTFVWQTMPESIALPGHTGVVRLSVDGAVRDNPEIDGQNQLWVRKKAAAQKAEADALSVEVFRKLYDGNPMTVETVLSLRVSGKPREETLNNAVLEGFVPLHFHSELPARIELDGKLRVQLKPGMWEVRTTARRSVPTDNVALTGMAHSGMEAEVWVFEAVPSLRVTEIKGVDGINPDQTNLPAEWRNLPAYLMKTGSALTIETLQRGGENPPASEFRLNREWRLNFSGKGYQLRDTISADINQPGRLEMGDAYDLERVSVNGADQFITHLEEGKAPGIEVRPGQVNIQAESTYEGNIRTLPAVGWMTGMQSLSGHLVLPPGWKLFHASGVDSVSDSWIARWTLLDVFLVLVLSVCIYRLTGRTAALIALPALVLVHQDFPTLAWTGIWLLLFMGLMRVLPQGKFWRLTRFAQVTALLFLAMVLLPALLLHVRYAIYPQLGEARTSSFIMRDQYAGGDTGAPNAAPTMAIPVPEVPPPVPPLPSIAEERMDELNESDQSASYTSRGRKMLGSSQAYVSSVPKQLYQYDPSQKVQTGRGVSTWRGNAVQLSWNGPVEEGQSLRLWLISPKENLVLALLRLVAVVWLLAIFCGMPVTPRDWGGWLRNVRGNLFTFTKACVLLILVAAALPGQGRADDFPPKDMLDELKAKLTRDEHKEPDCLPDCATIGRLHIDEQDSAVRLRMEVSAAADVAVPILRETQGWRPSAIVLDGKEAHTWQRDGTLLLHVNEGVHQVQIMGQAGNSDSLSVSLPLSPKQVTASLTSWDMQGVDEEGNARAAIQLTRRAGAKAAVQEDKLTPDPMPLYAQVTRSITLGINWEVETTVTRVSGGDSSGALEVPLLPGESVTSEGMRVKDGKVQVVLSSANTSVRWQSTLSPVDRLTLSAPESVAWSETWEVTVSNLWHSTAEGIPSLQRGSGMFWQPWPGESVSLSIARPTGASGVTKVLDSSELTLKPGERLQEATLALAIRSSQGDRHDVTLPEGSEVKQLSVNGREIPVSKGQTTVSFPLTPGQQQVRLRWNQPEGIRALYRTPKVDVGMSGVNARTRVDMPQDRWILMAGGPLMGPAVLFWSWIPVLLIVSFVLGRTALTPLASWQWFLLLLGLSQNHLFVSVTIVCWFLFVALRTKKPDAWGGWLGFNFRQIVLAGLTVLVIVQLFEGIKHGLLGSPNMRISGNDSYSYMLKWYQDISTAVLPDAWVLSLDILFYRALMLIWALWLAFSVPKWMRWAWECYSADGYWRRRIKLPSAKTPDVNTPPV